ncbi:MAG: hypothetical protein H0V75_02120 [Rubrobacter sp.]|nr:hypothetical protein [Rubrobacter sp.]
MFGGRRDGSARTAARCDSTGSSGGGVRAARDLPRSGNRPTPREHAIREHAIREHATVSVRGTDGCDAIGEKLSSPELSAEFGMSGGPTDTNKLLLALMGVVPLVVLATLGVSFLLVRAGFGLLVGAGVPFLVATIFVIGLSVALGRAAGGSGGSGGAKDEGSDDSGDGDGV